MHLPHSKFVLITLALLMLPGIASAESWPAYLHDNARSGMTLESFDMPIRLSPVWTYRPAVPPDPAWTEPSKEAARVRFDDAFHVVVDSGRAFFGSSGDNKIYALEAETARVLWTYFSDGPVRLAPTIWENRLYFGSDDGLAYCLEAETGKLVWKRRIADASDRVIGHGRIISLWPVRTGVLIDDGVAYVGAGVFPSESIFIAALDARNGTLLWRNDMSGDRGPEQQYDGISPQGYLLASRSTLYVPSGRSMPAAFDRERGRFLFYLRPGGKVGGAYALLTDDHLVAGVNEQRVYDPKTGKPVEGGYAWSAAHRLIVAGKISYSLGDHELTAINRSKVPEVAKKRGTFLAQRQTLQRAARELYRNRYRLDENAEGYQVTYDDLTAQLDENMKQTQTIGEQIQQLESDAVLWRLDNDLRDSMILSGNLLFVGGQERVIAVDAQTGQWYWTGTVEGRASGLAVSDGRLLVSTTAGTIHCFQQGAPMHVGSVVQPDIRRDPYPKDELTDVYKAAAARIVANAGVTKGFCLVLGSGKGRLALELARRTELNIYCIDEDAGDVAEARAAIDAAGLYGNRITIDHGSLAELPYPDYFANLIVSDDALVTGKLDAPVDEMFRVLRPVGGLVYLGQPQEASGGVSPLDVDALTAWMKGITAESPEPQLVEKDGLWIRLQRGPLPGAGSWTHQYANLANTSNSGDKLVKTPLGVLWFGAPGPERMVERHARAAAPVSLNGRLYVQGENVLMCYDAYNGTELWVREIPGAVRVRADVDGSNLAVSEHGVFLATRDKAMRLDPETGETLDEYQMPSPPDGKPRRWGSLATDGKTLFGTTAQPLAAEYGARWQNVSQDAIDNLNAYRRFNAGGGMWRDMQQWPDWGREDTWKGALTGRMITSDAVFGLDTDTGGPRFTYRGEISSPTITFAEGVMFLANNKVTEEEKKGAVDARRETYGLLTDEPETIDDYSDYDVRRFVALDTKNGESIWERVVDVTGSGGDKMGTAFYDGLFLIFGHFSNHDGSAFSKGGLSWRRVTVLDAKDGSDVWSKELNYLRRPFLMGDQLVVEPRAVDVHTGEFRTRIHPVTGEADIWEFKRGGHSCGICTGSEECFFLRSDSVNYYDMRRDHGMLPIGGTRAGCWINMITAGGLALLPEASAGCTCSFPIRSTIVMAPKRVDRKWTVYVTPGAFTPVRHWHINVGAPGDRKDATGNVWFNYPRLDLGYGVKFDLSERLAPQGRYFGQSPEFVPIENTDKPWVYSTGVVGLEKYELPLLGENDSPENYTVRLGFSEPLHEAAAKRVFDIKLQGEVVAADFDVFAAAGDKNTVVVKEFRDVPVESTLLLELVPKTTGGEESLPLLNSIEILR